MDISSRQKLQSLNDCTMNIHITVIHHNIQKLQSLNDYTMNIHIDGVPINQSNQIKSLGLIIDENLSRKVHIHEIFKKVPSGIGSLKRVRPFVWMHTAVNIYKGLIEPHFDCCSAGWDGLTQQLSENFKNFKIVLSELSPNLAMILVPDFFLTRLVGAIYRLEGLNKRLI